MFADCPPLESLNGPLLLLAQSGSRALTPTSGSAARMDNHHSFPLGKLRLIRQECFSLPIMLDHDHQVADIDGFAAEEAERALIAHCAAVPASG